MISYRGNSLGEAFANAANDKVWTPSERRALQAISQGLANSHYNDLLMAGLIEGTTWDGTEAQFRKPIAYSRRWSTGRIYGVEGHRIRFYVHESLAGVWNIGRVYSRQAKKNER